MGVTCMAVQKSQRVSQCGNSCKLIRANSKLGEIPEHERQSQLDGITKGLQSSWLLMRWIEEPIALATQLSTRVECTGIALAQNNGNQFIQYPSPRSSETPILSQRSHSTAVTAWASCGVVGNYFSCKLPFCPRSAKLPRSSAPLVVADVRSWFWGKLVFCAPSALLACDVRASLHVCWCSVFVYWPWGPIIFMRHTHTCILALPHLFRSLPRLFRANSGKRMP